MHLHETRCGFDFGCHDQIFEVGCGPGNGTETGSSDQIRPRMEIWRISVFVPEICFEENTSAAWVEARAILVLRRETAYAGDSCSRAVESEISCEPRGRGVTSAVKGCAAEEGC